jgi:hypothetical protein
MQHTVVRLLAALRRAIAPGVGSSATGHPEVAQTHVASSHGGRPEFATSGVTARARFAMINGIGNIVRAPY